MLNKELNRFCSAFTLLELLIVVAIAAILLCVAVPAWHRVVSRNQSAVCVDKLMSALQFARTEAVSLGRNVKFCKSTDLKNCCTNDCSWRDGWLIVVDNKYGKDNKKIIRKFKALSGSGKLIWQSSFGRDDFLEFAPFGTTSGQQGSFYYCPANSPTDALAVIVNHTGSMRITDKTADGKPIICR